MFSFEGWRLLLWLGHTVSKLQFLIRKKEYKKKIQLNFLFFFSFWSSKSWARFGSGSGPVSGFTWNAGYGYTALATTYARIVPDWCWWPDPDSLEMLDPDPETKWIWILSSVYNLRYRIRYMVYLTDIDGRLHALHIQRQLHPLI